MSQYFPKTFKNFGENVNAKVDLSNYATKVDIKNISRVDTANFALKSNLASLKLKLINDIDKLVPTAVDLSKISDVAGNDIIKKNASDKLVTKVNMTSDDNNDDNNDDKLLQYLMIKFES